MQAPQLFIVEYDLRGNHRNIVVRSEHMTVPEAWHWASCDAGVGVIPRFGQKNIRKVDRATAERFGISNVTWRLSGQKPAVIAQSATQTSD
ncbi:MULTISPECIES: DUF6555 family protein [Pseudomonas]|jgi:hypothetical protein|uniref:DUF6555 family protein n=1 Tax=Pseudomonas TaxID=286 RepID=UPI000ED625DC|nr:MULTISPECIES: DUF6555 family protein [Pseudomonas]RFQ03425.1 hypothetical protein D0O09_09315 [Pseudomonas putida]CAH0645782.1 hypothetical protein PSNVIR_00086 [Pseudomonas sp. Nvir]